eukprot:s702_g13.t1
MHAVFKGVILWPLMFEATLHIMPLQGTKGLCTERVLPSLTLATGAESWPSAATQRPKASDINSTSRTLVAK